MEFVLWSPNMGAIVPIGDREDAQLSGPRGEILRRNGLLFLVFNWGSVHGDLQMGCS